MFYMTSARLWRAHLRRCRWLEATVSRGGVSRLCVPLIKGGWMLHNATALFHSSSLSKQAAFQSYVKVYLTVKAQEMHEACTTSGQRLR